jgi:hypothetical protein
VSRDLAARVTIDHTDGLRRVAARPYDRPRSINLRFIELPDGHGYLVQAWGSAFPEDGGGGYQGRLPRPAKDVDASVDVLRQTWQKFVIENKYTDARGRIHHPFADGWNLASRELLDQVTLPLARVGHNTFKMLFTGGDRGLQTIRMLLVAALRRGENVISVESDGLMVPWGMLYTSPVDEQAYPADGNWSFDGFWGYRHVVEHTFRRIENFDSRISVGPDRVVVGLNVDRNVDRQFPKTPYITPVIDFFTQRAKVVLRHSKNELADAFQDPGFPDHITFFGCHGKVAAGDGRVEHPYLQLGDDEKIYGADMTAWLSGAPLATRPFVFVGACQGGQVCSAFYSTFGKALLDNGARCLIGPQVDLPPAFAYEYSRQLFTRFLDPGAKLGDIVRSLARTFLDEHANPLGLMFSLYRGMDVHLWVK